MTLAASTSRAYEITVSNLFKYLYRVVTIDRSPSGGCRTAPLGDSSRVVLASNASPRTALTLPGKRTPLKPQNLFLLLSFFVLKHTHTHTLVVLKSWPFPERHGWTRTHAGFPTGRNWFRSYRIGSVGAVREKGLDKTVRKSGPVYLCTGEVR